LALSSFFCRCALLLLPNIFLPRNGSSFRGMCAKCAHEEPVLNPTLHLKSCIHHFIRWKITDKKVFALIEKSIGRWSCLRDLDTLEIRK
jgi:hypothetical protein